MSSRRRDELAFALRVSVAAALALIVAQALRLPMPLWSVMAAVIVNQLSVGRSLRTSVTYVLGTVGGSLYGAAVSLLIPHASEAALLAVLVITVAPVALYVASHANMNVVTVSALIVLLMPAFGQRDSLQAATDRVLEVAVGATVGVLVALFIVPSSAHRQTRETAARMLDEMADTLKALAAGVVDGMTAEAVSRVQDRLDATGAELNALGGEAEQERSARVTAPSAFRWARRSADDCGRCWTTSPRPAPPT